ncbi:50S ribosomal protein L9 [Labilibaculum sp. A4]|uniref:Large ribosomal subunit protein bL9 n=1 Tax=Labilibaculum euxinus TaxID=2686357 RepID=A0A425YG23_9BACT|nr:50S ribosomal protein L9 [Labilibaculum euxinus]MDQ1770268.1 50S ribosomal protein L9 [Labilibaculum euxinus]MUP38009.1 50S ribosomal protein L9 [Labilibaculum euxinus]MVB07214.1 50S ribosomal protein L9 [Labilibaculum euxinus]MWN75513.1 50S ribosomal protein L9 [Labilibaculum euxinus]
MEVILKQDIHSLGYMNDIVVVKNGYGRNYLIPKGIAVLATESAKKMNAENMRQRAHKEEKIKNEALEIAKKLEGVTLSVGAKTSTTGKIFGSVNNIQIAEALTAQGFEIDRKVIAIKDAVKEIGKYTATIKLHKEVKVDIEFDVVSE